MAARRGSLGTSAGRRGAMAAGAGPVGLSAALAASREMERLRERLLESLTSTVNDTVETVCEEFEESLAQATQLLFANGGASGRGGAKGKGVDAASADYDLYYSCCRRLVAYIVDNMVTSPDFAQQMDRIILACHSNASEHVLHSVVTKSLWFHRRDSSAADNDDEPEGEDDDEDDLAPPVRAKPSRAYKREPSTRGVKRRAPPPPPPPAKNFSKMKSPVKKRARKELTAKKPRYSRPREESANEGTEDEEPKRKPRRRRARVQSSDEDDGDQDEEDEDYEGKNEHATQPHYAQADELLKFKDAIGDMCYPERRTPAQTRFFKDRLRKAIQFVDAQLCKPPKGKLCGWGCVKIRRQMCNRDLPCRNKVCRLWHDVEAHTDRCQNTHCEFRIRVMLRETMYKIDHKKMELNDFRAELQLKKKKLQDLKHESLSDHETFVERRLLDNEISQFESDIEEADKELGVFKATKKAYWATLNEIGLTIEDDTNDQFPDFDSHYVVKKAPVKKKPTPNSQIADESGSARSQVTPRPQRGRRGGANPHNDDGTLSRPFTSLRQSRERITRRSTQQSVQAMTNGVIELDDDDDDDEEEETKTDRSDTENATRISEAKISGYPAENASRSSAQETADREAHQGDNDLAEPIEEVELSTGVEEKDEGGTTSGAEDPQSADYVIDEPEDQHISTQADGAVEETPSNSIDQVADPTTEQTVSTDNTTLAAFNDVVDGPTSSEPTAQESGASESASDTPANDSGPLLPF